MEQTSSLRKQLHGANSDYENSNLALADLTSPLPMTLGHRWGMASYSLTCYFAIGVNEKQALSKTVKMGYLTQEEASSLAIQGYNAACPILWMLPLYEKQFPDIGRHWGQITTNILQMRNGVSCVLTSVSTFGQLPLPLVHLMSVFVKFQLFLDALKCGTNNAEVIIATIRSVRHFEKRCVFFQTFYAASLLGLMICLCVRARSCVYSKLALSGCIRKPTSGHFSRVHHALYDRNFLPRPVRVCHSNKQSIW
jgi:hypothetical protein